MKQLEELISAVLALGKPIRFWGNPDNKNSWRTLHQMGIDYFNTDQSEACAAFFRGL